MACTVNLLYKRVHNLERNGQNSSTKNLPIDCLGQLADRVVQMRKGSMLIRDLFSILGIFKPIADIKIYQFNAKPMLQKVK
jgi:hypothetical protein